MEKRIEEVPFMINGNNGNIVYAKNIKEVEAKLKKHKSISKYEIKSIEMVSEKVNVHNVKIHPIEFENLCVGLKRSEYRKNDRDYRINDLMILNEWQPTEEYYTGRSATVLITHVQTGFVIPDGYAVLSIQMINNNFNN